MMLELLLSRLCKCILLSIYIFIEFFCDFFGVFVVVAAGGGVFCIVLFSHCPSMKMQKPLFFLFSFIF